MNLRTLCITVVLAVTFLALPAAGEKRQGAAPPSREDFFIVSSVNTSKRQLLLKHPTEVTELIVVDDKTVCVDEDGKRIRFSDLRAGDTVYIASLRGLGGERIAARIRKAPMTLEELHRRYLKFQ